MKTVDRRQFLRQAGIAAAAEGGPRAADANTIVVDPAPRFEISPLVYMQFMEPLGSTDSSAEAAWDYDRDDWPKDSWTWSRTWRRARCGLAGSTAGITAGAKVWVRSRFAASNLPSDGEKGLRAAREGDRTGAREVAEWVAYANDPDNRERKSHGVAEPSSLKLWRIGNETSYGTLTFTPDESIATTIEFAKAKSAILRFKLSGWGDRGRGANELWAGELPNRANEYLAEDPR